MLGASAVRVSCTLEKVQRQRSATDAARAEARKERSALAVRPQALEQKPAGLVETLAQCKFTDCCEVQGVALCHQKHRRKHAIRDARTHGSEQAG